MQSRIIGPDSSEAVGNPAYDREEDLSGVMCPKYCLMPDYSQQKGKKNNTTSAEKNG